MSLEQLMTDTLAERADEPAYPSTRYWEVVDRAAAIRNRRRHRVLAVAAAVAVVVPLALAGPAIHRAVTDAPATPTPTHSPTQAPAHQRGDHPQRIPRLTDIPRGQAPDVAYLAGDTVVDPDGSTHALPSGAGLQVDWGVPFGNGYLLHSNKEIIKPHLDKTESTLRRVAGNTVTELGCGSYSLGTEAGGARVAYWLATSCATYRTSGTLYVADTATGQATPYLTTTKKLGALQPVGIVGDRVIAEADRARSESVVSVGPDGSVRRVPGLHYAFGFDRVHQWVLGEAPSGRHVVLDPVTGKVQWSTDFDSWTLSSASPDGRVVLGIRDTTGAEQEFALLDATDGHVLARIQPAGPASFESIAAEVRGWTWDHDALLSDVVAYQGNAILRSDTSGTKVATKIVPWSGGRTGKNPAFYGLLSP